MQYYRCKCGESQAWGSMPPYSCSGCSRCGTTLDQHPEHHRTPEPHQWQTDSVDTDNGPQPVTRCSWCGTRKLSAQPTPSSETMVCDRCGRRLPYQRNSDGGLPQCAACNGQFRAETWTERQARIEDGGIVSAGGLVTDMRTACQHCQWWTETPLPDFAPRLNPDDRWGDCDMGRTHGPSSAHLESKVYAVAQPNGAILKTRADFGCAQWKVREQE